MHQDTGAQKPSPMKLVMAAVLVLMTCYLTSAVLETFAIIILALSPQDTASTANLIAYEAITFALIAFLGFKVFIWSLRRK